MLSAGGHSAGHSAASG